MPQELCHLYQTRIANSLLTITMVITQAGKDPNTLHAESVKKLCNLMHQVINKFHRKSMHKAYIKIIMKND